VLFILLVVLIVGSLILSQNCPSAGLAVTREARELHRLKNRTVLPREADFDGRISLDELLKPGDDRSRWSSQHAARIEAYVIDVASARAEAANCFLPGRRDVHIVVAGRKDAPQNEQVVLEVSPNLRERAAQQGADWSESALRAQLLGHWCEFEGWLYFDVGHADQSENTAPHNPTNWRATGWEIHPITKFRVIR
jgi:hypothetical protein